MLHRQTFRKAPVLRHRFVVPYVAAALFKSGSVSAGVTYSVENECEGVKKEPASRFLLDVHVMRID